MGSGVCRCCTRITITSLAEQNRVKEVPILAPRGRLLDREGRPIVDNYPSFSALLLRPQGKVSDSNLDAIAEGLHLDAADLKARVKRLSAMPGYQPIFIKFDITPDELAFVESHRNEFPELDTITVHRRLYPKNGFMAHLIGYVGEVSEDMLNNPRYELYNSGDVVGQSGVEAEYNDMLMGKNGSRRVLVNSKGKEVGELSDTPAVPGKALQLTIDLDLQIAAEEALGDKPGAIVAMDPKTGEILAMASRPTFDPNAFAVRISSKEWNGLLTDPGKPLLNKAIQAQLAPGSVFKIIMSVAGWQEGIAQTLHVNCGGGASFYGRYFKCWVKGGHGSVTLTKGIYQSCDVFFYTLAERLGIERIAKYATALGLGQKTGIDLPQEVSGVMPSEEWKLKNYRQKWFAGETISVGIGQGAVATTPVQLMRAISAISMGGHLVRPHVVFPDKVPETYRNALHYTDTQEIPIDPAGWDTITDAMGEVLLPERYGAERAYSRHRHCGQNRIGSDDFKRHEGQDVQQGSLQGQRMVCRLHAPPQSGHHGLRSVRGRRARKTGGATGDPGHQGIRGQEESQTYRAPEASVGGWDAGGAGTGSSATPAVAARPTEVTGLWSDGGSDSGHLQAARFRTESATHEFHRAVAAPGMEQFAQNRRGAPDRRRSRKQRAIVAGTSRSGGRLAGTPRGGQERDVEPLHTLSRF